MVRHEVLLVTLPDEAVMSVVAEEQRFSRLGDCPGHSYADGSTLLMRLLGFL